MSRPFWEDTYQNKDISTFGTEPNCTIVKYQHEFDKAWDVLEVGCGEGQNALYLARNGFNNVEAFDLSVNVIQKVEEIAKKEEASIHAWAEDLCTYRFTKMYDLILSFGTLHFVRKEDWHRFLTDAKEHTRAGGYHIIQIFTNTVPPSSDIAPYVKGLSDDGELKDIYQDWDIVDFQSYVFEDEHPGVPKHLHASNKIVVKKR